MDISKLIFVILTFPIYSLILLLIFIYFSFAFSIAISKMFIYGDVDKMKKVKDKFEKLKEYAKILKEE